MIARLQKITVFGYLALLAVWLLLVWPSITLFVTGVLALAVLSAFYLGLLFLLIHYWNRTDPAPRATWVELGKAWLREARAAQRVFMWWQPFRHLSIPDHLTDIDPNKRGVVFIHGFMCNRGFWMPWMRTLQAQQRAFVSVSLEPIFGSIDEYPQTVEDAIAKVTAATGQAPTLICHSMGGLAARAWLRSASNADARVHRVITIGTPHSGTQLSLEVAMFIGKHVNTVQMRRLGDWVTALAKTESPERRAKFVCWYASCDNIVAPTSTAMLDGADNRLVKAQGHVSMAFDARVMNESLALLN